MHEKKVEIEIIKQTAAVKKVVEALDSCINGQMAEMEQKGCLRRDNFKGGVSTFTEYTVHLARTQYHEHIQGSGRPEFHQEFASLSFLVSLKKVSAPAGRTTTPLFSKAPSAHRLLRSYRRPLQGIFDVGCSNAIFKIRNGSSNSQYQRLYKKGSFLNFMRLLREGERIDVQRCH